MSAASCGSFSSLRSRPRAAKFSRHRTPWWRSCNPVWTVSRPQPKRRSAWRALPPHSSVATSARNKRRWCPVSRLAPDRIKASKRAMESSMGVAQPDGRAVINRPRVSHHPAGQDSSGRGRFPPAGRLITRLLKLRRQSRSLKPRPHGGGHPPALDHAGQKRLRQLVRTQPDATLQELAGRVGVRCSRMAIFRTLRKLKITRKEKSLHAQERDSPRVRRKRRAFREEVATVDPEHLVFIDETGANTAMTRTYGRAPRGQRVQGSVPGHWK